MRVPPATHHYMFSPSDLDTEGLEGGFHPVSSAVPARRRLVPVSNTNGCEAKFSDSHDERLARVRESLQRGNVGGRGVRNAIEMVSALAARIGPVRDDQGVPRALFRQQWSAFNVPLMRAAAVGDRESPVLSLLANACNRAGNVAAVVVDTVGHDAVFEAWHALSGVMRSWCIRSREDLSEWIHRQCFVQPRWKGHFSGRAQERIITTAALIDVRASALKSAYVRVALHACEETPPCETFENVASARANLSLTISLIVVGQSWTTSICKTYSRRDFSRSGTHVGKFWKSDMKQPLLATM